VVCTDGRAELGGYGAPVVLAAGSAAFVRAAVEAPAVALTGTGQAFVASPGLA